MRAFSRIGSPCGAGRTWPEARAALQAAEMSSWSGSEGDTREYAALRTGRVSLSERESEGRFSVKVEAKVRRAMPIGEGLEVMVVREQRRGRGRRTRRGRAVVKAVMVWRM